MTAAKPKFTGKLTIRINPAFKQLPKADQDAFVENHLRMLRETHDLSEVSEVVLDDSPPRSREE